MVPRGLVSRLTDAWRTVLGAALIATALLAGGLPAGAAVDDPDAIDALKADPAKPFVSMVIVQDRPWSPETHVMLGNKMAGYIRYALGGQLVRDTPAASGMKVRVVLVSDAAPSADDVAVLEEFRRQMAGAGVDFVWGGETDLPALVGE